MRTTCYNVADMLVSVLPPEKIEILDKVADDIVNGRIGLDPAINAEVLAIFAGDPRAAAFALNAFESCIRLEYWPWR